MRSFVALCILALATFPSLAQTPWETAQPKASAPQGQILRNDLHGAAPTQMNRMMIVLDPAHGGSDRGAQIGDAIIEKDVTLSLAFRLRSLLTARGFTVVMTRDSDSPASPNDAGSALTLDDRAGIANHAQAAACLLLHATGSGNGVHLYTSDLNATSGEPSFQPWLTAQAAWVPQSRQLEKQLAAAFTRAGVPLVAGIASVRPLDSLTCPAVVLELAPEDSNPDTINYADYQQRIAQAIAGALLFWPNRVRPPSQLPSAASTRTPNTAVDNTPTAPGFQP